MLKNDNFKEVLGKEKIAVVLISGEGCANCVSMYPMVMGLESKYPEVKVYSVEVDDDNYKINDYYDVEIVPTILITSYGELISKVKGYQPEEIFDLYIEAKIEEINEKSKK